MSALQDAVQTEYHIDGKKGEPDSIKKKEVPRMFVDELSEDEIKKIEDLANDIVKKDFTVIKKFMKRDEAEGLCNACHDGTF